MKYNQQTAYIVDLTDICCRCNQIKIKLLYLELISFLMENGDVLRAF